MIKILTVVGARPQIIKAAAISRTVSTRYRHALHEVLVHTGQHYDPAMSGQFFHELGIPKPAYNLEAGSGSHGAQTAAMLAALERTILAEQPHCVLIYGDTNSTVAAALAAAKLHIPVAHVEAGMRSFDKTMPEELNRVLSDHASTFLLCPTDTAVHNLRNEGFRASSRPPHINHPLVANVGDVMYDNALHYTADSAVERSIGGVHLSANGFMLATLHRASNTADSTAVETLLGNLAHVAAAFGESILFPMHPRTSDLLGADTAALDALYRPTGVRITEPLGYRDILWCAKNASVVITDSGGLQKEAAWLGTPSVVLRDTTEWVELVEQGFVLLSSAQRDALKAAVRTQRGFRGTLQGSPYGTGDAAGTICDILLKHLAP
jgi:UDP-GlcNAc3NAcA epimerase